MAKKMKKDWSQFTLKIAINKPPTAVFRAWTDERIVSKWFTVKTAIEPRKNGRIYYEWLEGDKMDAKVIAVVKNRSFTFPFGDKGERVTVKFKKNGRGCICELHQYNMKTDDVSKSNMHLGCAQGWTFFLTNLKSYLEHGIDLRGHDKRNSYRQGFINS